MNKSKFTKFRKGAIATLCAVAVTCTGIAAACNPNDKPGSDESSTPRKEDTQLLKNGNFEYTEVPEKAVHLIKNVTNWTRAGDSSGAMSGIINTSDAAWNLMSAYDLMDKLDYNNDLRSDDSDYEEKYVDYNGMDSSDIPYIEPYAASLSDKLGDDEDGYAINDLIRKGSAGKQEQRSYWQFLGIERNGTKESGYTYSFRGKPVYFDSDSNDYYMDEAFTHPVRYEVISNPQTHYGAYKQADGKHYLGDKQVLVDEDGNYYFDLNGNGEIDILEDESVGNVLMIHNYPTNTKYNGIEQHYSSHSITLEANTAAEISLWVKTSDLKFDKGYLLKGDPVIGLDQQDRGAYIEVTQSVSSTTIDSFKIKAINTEKIIADNDGKLGENESNGWLKYTIYVNACDFADSTITINLGLGGNSTDEKVTGYAFFDDVEVKKYIDLEEGSYNEKIADTIFDKENGISYCSLISDSEEKVFYADKQTVPGAEDDRFSTRFHYLVDLASEDFTAEASQKKAIAFNNEGLDVSVELTNETSSGKTYASAEGNHAHVNGLKRVDGEYTLPDSMKDTGGRPTFNDLIGIYDSSKKEFTADDFDKTATDDSGRGNAFRNLSARLNPVLTGESGLTALQKFCSAYDLGESYNGSMLLTLSAYGAAYTTTIQNKEGSTLFTVEGTKSENDTNYKILSFWVKTSDLDGSEAATIKLVDVADEDNVAIISVDSTNVTTDVGDVEDIYSGWVQCFFFIKNNTKEDMSFKIEFSFGNTNITDAAATSFNYGWAAMANIQSLAVTEDVFDIVAEGEYSKILTFADENPKAHTPFDNATRMSNVKKGIANPSSYNGVNGGSSYVTDKKFGDSYDRLNNHNGITGLINREGFEEDGKYDEALRGEILGSFIKGAKNWNDVFGEQCYQPLIIVDNLRTYYDRATKDADYIKAHLDEFWYKNDEGQFVSAKDTTYDEKTTYYSESDLVKNYGFIGNRETVNAGSYKTISVRVMVTGDATAWIYLVDSSSYDVLSFDIPEYTYYYDDEGNVLSEPFDSEWTNAEHRDAIVYTLRADGLYDGKDGGVYANLSNLTKRFKYPKFERNTFYMLDKDGKGVEVRYDDLEDGVTYYNDEACKVVASHYLCADGQRVYEYDSSTGSYYYLVSSERSTEVKDFAHEYARPYSLDRAPSEYEYAVKVDNTGVDANGKPKWVTVNFVIHTGENDLSYRLELWSGKRDETGVTEGMTKDSEVNGAVAFDYSASAITESNASSVLAEYETKIKDVYRELIFNKDGADKLDKLAEDMNITYLENILDELKVSEADRKAALKAAGLDEEFVAEYYTFTWYDSAQYVPFNQETAEAGQTGYGYTASSNDETLVYFKTRDYSNNSYNVFVDYSAIDQTISIDSVTEDDHDHENENENDNGQSPWLLITSIVLVVVLLFVLVAILVRYLWKNHSKKRGQKQMQKNNYKQRERYIRKLGLVKAAPVEEATETPAEEVPAEEAPVEEAPAEEVPAEEAPAEEAPAEEVPAEEAPVEEAPAEEAPAEEEKKDE